MAITFALIARLVTVGGGWAVRANQIRRTPAPPRIPPCCFCLRGWRGLFARSCPVGRRTRFRGNEAISRRGGMDTRVLSVAVLIAVAAIALGLDQGILTRLSLRV